MIPHNTDSAALAPSELPPTPVPLGGIGDPPDAAEEGDAEDFDYDPIPPKTTITVSVRYRIGGRGQPLPYPQDERDNE